jgi:hypothetical protein
MHQQDGLFWFQLLFPICDISKSGIPNDPRMSFYSDVERFTRLYAAQSGSGGTYGHKVNDFFGWEILQFHAAVIHDGVHGGSNGGIHRRWNPKGSSYDPELASCLTLSRWREIRRYVKLCDNRLAPKKGEEGYDPAYKVCSGDMVHFLKVCLAHFSVCTSMTLSGKYLFTTLMQLLLRQRMTSVEMR